VRGFRGEHNSMIITPLTELNHRIRCLDKTLLRSQYPAQSSQGLDDLR